MTDFPRIPNTPGLTWRRRRILMDDGTRRSGWEGRWRPRTDLVTRGYSPTPLRLWMGIAPSEVEAQWISARCIVLQDKMLIWANGGGHATNKTNRVHMPGHVYFMTDDVEIKIGYSGSPIIRRKRLKQERGREVRILRAISGTPDDEKALHKRFKHLRTTGEWFRPESELMEFIQSLVA